MKKEVNTGNPWTMTEVKTVETNGVENVLGNRILVKQENHEIHTVDHKRVENARYEMSIT